MKDQRLELAEAYYLVARDLEYNAQEFARIAGLLNRRADAICELKISDEARDAVTGPPVQEPT